MMEQTLHCFLMVSDFLHCWVLLKSSIDFSCCAGWGRFSEYFLFLHALGLLELLDLRNLEFYLKLLDLLDLESPLGPVGCPM